MRAHRGTTLIYVEWKKLRLFCGLLRDEAELRIDLVTRLSGKNKEWNCGTTCKSMEQGQNYKQVHTGRWPETIG
jgi:hypothetical protein